MPFRTIPPSPLPTVSGPAPARRWTVRQNGRCRESALAILRGTVQKARAGLRYSARESKGRRRKKGSRDDYVAAAPTDTDQRHVT